MTGPSSSLSQLVAQIERGLRRHANAARSDLMSGGYAPSRLRCIGATVPEMRAIGREIARETKAAPARQVIKLALSLTRTGAIEARQIGYELIARRPDAMALLTPRLIRALGRGNDNWASVDGFATHLAGPAWRLARVSDRNVLAWATSSDEWWRRTALASTVALNVRARGGAGDTRRTLMICHRFASGTNPMLAKALSWALRSLVPHDPGAVRRFLAQQAGLPAIVRREVTAKLTTGRKARRPA